MILNTVALRAREQLEKLQTVTVGQWQLLLAGCLCGRLSMWLTRTASAKWFQLQFVINSLSYGEIKCLTKSCIPKSVSSPHTEDGLFYLLLFLVIPHSASFISLWRQLLTSGITMINPSLRDCWQLDTWSVWWGVMEHPTKCTINSVWKSSV